MATIAKSTVIVIVDSFSDLDFNGLAVSKPVAVVMDELAVYVCDINGEWHKTGLSLEEIENLINPKDYTTVHEFDFSNGLPSTLETLGVGASIADETAILLCSANDSASGAHPRLQSTETFDMRDCFVMARLVLKPGIQAAGYQDVALKIFVNDGTEYSANWDLYDGFIKGTGGTMPGQPLTFPTHKIWFRVRLMSTLVSDLVNTIHNVYVEYSFDDGRSWITNTAKHVPTQINKVINASKIQLHAANYGGGGSPAPIKFDRLIIGKYL
jgi:hypothetical protein